MHYRDARTDGVSLPVAASELYATTGIQHLPFNTIYQLAAAAGTPALAAARTLLLIPDLLAYWLTGTIGAEVTNASTTALLDVSDADLGDRADGAGRDPGSLFPPLRQPGDVIGPVDTRRRARRAARGGRQAAAAGRRRVARHRVGGGRRPAGRAGLRLHLLGHLVAGRDGARPAGGDRGEPGGELHQRGGRRRDRPLPAQRQRALAAAGVPAALGAGRRPGGRAAAAAAAKSGRCGSSSTPTTRCSCRPTTCRAGSRHG